MQEIRDLAARARYPLRTFDDLAELFGAEDAVLTLRGASVTLRDARSVIPEYYFPIGSEADFVAKLADLSESAGGDEHALHEEWAARAATGGRSAAPADCWS